MEVHRVEGRGPFGASGLSRDKLGVQRARQPRDDFVLNIEEIAERFVEPLVQLIDAETANHLWAGSAHYWARRFRAMGHEVKLTPPIYVKPYVKRGKNDAADAAAICDAMSRPNMRFVAVK